MSPIIYCDFTKFKFRGQLTKFQCYCCHIEGITLFQSLQLEPLPVSLCFRTAHLSNPPEILPSQEEPSVEVEDNTDYFRFGNIN
jgi:hypothetical protein